MTTWWMMYTPGALLLGPKATLFRMQDALDGRIEAGEGMGLP